MGQSCCPSIMGVGVLILLLLGEQLSAAPPAVFDDYFEQDVKAVHLTQRGVIKACLPEDKWTQLLAKFEAANTACEVANENARFDWATLAKLNQGGDGDGNGVQFNLESAEGCLYRQLEWTDGTKLKAKIVKEDFTGLPSNIWNRLEIDLKECYNWNGEFQKKKKRKKREVGELGELGELGEEVGQADASNLLNWAKELLPGGSLGSAEGGLRRRKRASSRRKNSSEKKTEEKKSKKKGKKSGKKTKGKKSGKKKGNKSGTRKKKKKKKGKGEKSGSKSPEKSGGSGLKQEVYNQLWCADLAVEKALRRCAMQKIQG